MLSELTCHSLPSNHHRNCEKENEEEDTSLRKVAKELEASFLAEMLKYSGVAVPSDSFGGGAGEDAFASFLINQYADQFAGAGGIGLAENIFHSLKKWGTISEK